MFHIAFSLSCGLRCCPAIDLIRVLLPAAAGKDFYVAGRGILLYQLNGRKESGTVEWVWVSK